MRVEELSIGDWVRYDRGTDAVQIMGIYVRNNQECVVMSDSYFPDGVIGFVECIKPIPITPEILEKNGFEEGKRYDGLDVRVFSNGNISVSIPQYAKWNRVRVYDDEGLYELSSAIIYYVHQLQHALRLAGVGKEIEV